MVRHAFVLAAALSLAACGGGAPTLEGPASNSLTGSGLPGAASSNGDPGTIGGPPSEPAKYRGDGSSKPAWGGWAWGDVPADAVAKAGFDWFETGYPSDKSAAVNQTLRAAGVRPFGYINLGELDPTLAAQAKYTGTVLRTNGDWGTQLVDVTDVSWQDWIVRRADDEYRDGSRGVKWDVATPDVPPGKTRGDVNDAIASILARVRQQHPDMKFVFNQGMEFVLAYPQFADGLETEGLYSAIGANGANFLKPWQDQYYWGPQYQQVKAVQAKGIPIFNAEYVDPASAQARQLYDAMVADGVVPYITNDHWNIRGMGLGVNPGW